MLVFNGRNLSPTSDSCVASSAVKKIVAEIVGSTGVIKSAVTVWQKLKKVAATASGSRAGETAGTFQDGVMVSGVIKFNKTFATPPTLNYTVSGSGHWENHNNGAEVKFSNVTITDANFTFFIYGNPGNNYTYDTWFDWTASGQIWAADV